MVLIEEVSTASRKAPSSKLKSNLPENPGKLVVEDSSNGATTFSVPILNVPEAEIYVDELQEFNIEQVGCPRWLQQHERLEKLNLQAHQSARSQTDEFVLEAFLTFGKLPCLIRDILLIDCWREYVLPLMIDDLCRIRATMKAYFVLYHEATVINLLEVLMYHFHSCEAAGDALIELIDYCASKAALLNSGRLQKQCTSYELKEDERRKQAKDSNTNIRQVAEELAQRDPAEELRHQMVQVQLQVSITAIAVLRFICGHSNDLSIAVLNRLIRTHDVPLLLIPLIENPPWTRRLPQGSWEKMVDFKWQPVEPTDLLKVTKNEGQAWLALYHLLCSAEVRQRYHFNAFRKGQLLRVRKYLNEVMLDQLPILTDVARFLDELSIADVPEPTAIPSGLLLEQVPELRDSIVKGKKWSEVAKEQLAEAFNRSDAADEGLRSLATVYTTEWMDEVAGGETKCGRCGQAASKKCSRCGIEWYCSRKCQVAAWKAHKTICDVVAANKA